MTRSYARHNLRTGIRRHRRNSGGLPDSIVQVLRDYLAGIGIPAAGVEEAMAGILQFVAADPDIGDEELVELVVATGDGIAAMYAEEAPAAAPDAPASPFSSAPKTAWDYWPEPVSLDADQTALWAMSTVNTLLGRFVKNVGDKDSFRGLLGTSHGYTLTRDALELGYMTEPGVSAYTSSDYQTAIENSGGKLTFKPLYRWFASILRNLMVPGTLTSESFGTVWNRERGEKMAEQMPAMLLALSRALEIPYNPVASEAWFPAGDCLLTANRGRYSAQPGPAGESHVVWQITRGGGEASVSLILPAGGVTSTEVERRLNLRGYEAQSTRGQTVKVAAGVFSQIPALLPEYPAAPEALAYVLAMLEIMGPGIPQVEPDKGLIAMMSLLTPEDQQFITDYYAHFAELSSETVKEPTDPRQRAAVLGVLRRVVNDATSVTFYPEIVENPPEFLDLIVESLPVDRKEAVSFGFYLQKYQKMIRMWIALPWTTGDLTNGRQATRNLAHRPGPGNDSDWAWRKLGNKLPHVAARNAGKLTDKQDVQWRVPFRLLSAQGKGWAQESADNFTPYWQNGSEYQGPGESVLLANTHYEFEVVTKSDRTEIDRMAAFFEAKGLYPLAAALRIAFAGQSMAFAKDERLPFASRAPRLEDVTVTGRAIAGGGQSSVFVPGLGTRDADFRVLDKPDDKTRTEIAAAVALVEDFSTTVTVPSRVVGGSPTQETWKLHDFQKLGTAYALLSGGRTLITDEMGLGKTVQALAFLSVNPNPYNDQPSLPALVVCPGSVETNWIRECNTWLPNLKAIGFTSNPVNIHQPHDVMVTSWNMISLYPDVFKKGNYQTLICDEAHYAKRLRAKGRGRPTLAQSLASLLASGGGERYDWGDYVGRTAAMLMLSETIPNRLLLTGTPMSNGNPRAFWTMLNALDPLRFPELRAFEQEYLPQRAANGGDDDDNNGPEESDEDVLSRFDALNTVLDYYMVRRIKQSVADQARLGALVIPEEGVAVFGPRKRTVLDVLDLTEEQDGYLEAFKENVETLISDAYFNYRLEKAIELVVDKNVGPAEAVELVNAIDADPARTKETSLAVNQYARQYVGELKVPNAAEWIQRKVQVERKPVVVWVWHNNVSNALVEVLKRTMVDGNPVRYAVINTKHNNSAKQKGAVVQKFQRGEIDVIVGSSSMAEGVTLTRSSEALFVEYWYEPGKVTQAEDRIFRIGQKDDVIITTLHAPGTIDDDLALGLAEKRGVLSEITGVDRYEGTALASRLDEKYDWMVETVLKRLEDQIETASMRSHYIEVAHLKDALTDNPKNIIEVYTLAPAYTDSSVLDFPVKLLIDLDGAEALTKTVKGFNLNPARTAVIVALESAPNQTMSRAALHASIALLKGGVIDKAVADLANPSVKITTGYQEPAGLVFADIKGAGSKKVKTIRRFQAAGGALTRDEMKEQKIRLSKADLNDLVVAGILKIQRRQKMQVRNNPRRRPGQMVVRGKLAVLPFNADEAACDHDYYEPGSPEEHKARQNRLRILNGLRGRIDHALKNDRRAHLPSLSHPASQIRVALRRGNLPRFAEEAKDAYNRLHEAVQAHRDAQVPVKAEYVQLLRKAHPILSRYE